MNLFMSAKNILFDFIFPKNASVAALDRLTPGELVRLLPAATDTKDESVVAIFDYKNEMVREMIWELKYRGSRIVARTLSVVLMDVVKAELAERALFENFQGRILLIPMPVSKKRRNERGYNQIEILCEALMKHDTEHLLAYLPNVLRKHKHTDSQTVAGRKAERLENIEHSMSVPDPLSVQGASIILIDDVTTTGATFREARRALREAGAKKILCIAVAH
ncbi:MAG: competence protein competence protein ComFC [Parcubacteria group bacterium]|nr:competence protein competence protein ComFC [Parcubacteria group bacterium]